MFVRQGRDGLELRVDGGLASLYRPGPELTGKVWWGLAAPVVLAPGAPRRRVLLLGLGGGSVARAVRALDPDAEIVGVDHDRSVLRLARRHLGLDRVGLEVIADDAFRYLKRERRRFDLVVEDVFVGPLRSVHKPAGLLDEGYRLIRKRLRRGGLVVSNTIHETPAVVRAMRRFGGRVLSLAVSGHWNHVVVAGPGLPAPRELRRVLRAYEALAPLVPSLTIRTE